MWGPQDKNQFGKLHRDGSARVERFSVGNLRSGTPFFVRHPKAYMDRCSEDRLKGHEIALVIICKVFVTLFNDFIRVINGEECNGFTKV